MRILAILALSPLAIAAPLSARPVDSPDDRGHDMTAMPRAPPLAEPETRAQRASPADPASRADQPTGTDLDPGKAPPPPVAHGRAADRYFDPEAMAMAEAGLRGEHGEASFHKITFNLAEYQLREGRDGYRWDASAWFGTDSNRLLIKSEGEGDFGQSALGGEVQVMWSHGFDPYWNLEAGLRQDFGQGAARSYASLGIEGLAPFWFDLGGWAFVSSKGELLGRVEAGIDQRITQKLIIQPRLEANFSAQAIPQTGIGAGLMAIELGLRLRYELAREFAPYLGLSWERKFGQTAALARRAGERRSSASLAMGVRFWF